MDAPNGAQVGVLRSDAGIVEPGGNGMRRFDLSVFGLEEHGHLAVQDAGRAEIDRRGIVASRLTGTGRLNADDAYGCVIHERVEHADGIGAAAHRRDDHIGKPPGFFQHLGTGFAPDDALKIPDQRGEGVRTRRRTKTIVCGLLRGDPVTQGLVDGVLEGPGAALDGPDFSAEQLHAPHVGGLALHVLGTHENDAFKPQTGGGSGCRHAVLARAGFRDQRRFAHMLGEQRLPERVVDLVRAGVQQILAFQPQREAEPFGQSGAVG